MAGKKLASGQKIAIGLLTIGVAGTGIYLLMRKKEAPPVCTEGETQTRICSDGSVITTATCSGGKWVSTGATCPTPEEINAEITDVRFTHGAYNPGDTIIIGVEFTNTGNASHTFKIGVAIGKDAIIWYDKGYYNDGYGDYREVSLVPGGSIIVERSLIVPADGRIADIWATVRDENLNVLHQMKKFGVISVATAVTAQISNIVVNGGGTLNKIRGQEVAVYFDLKNTGTLSTIYDLAIEFDTMADVYYDVFVNGIDTPSSIAPGETKRFVVKFDVPLDAPLNHYYSIGVYVYAINTFNRSNPSSGYLDKKSVFDVIYVS